MTRVPVPDDYEDRDVPLPENGDFESLRGYTGRVAQVREDEGGRYVGVPEQIAGGVAGYLGVELDTADDEDEEGADGESETCQTVKSDGEVCGRDLPCPYHSDDEEDEE